MTTIARPRVPEGECLPDEQTMADFLVMCGESLDPDQNARVEELCRWLALTRKRSLRLDSYERARAIAARRFDETLEVIRGPRNDPPRGA